MDDNNKQGRKEKKNEKDKTQSSSSSEDAAKNQTVATRNSPNTANQRMTSQGPAQQSSVTLQNPPTATLAPEEQPRTVSVLSTNLMREEPHNLSSNQMSAHSSPPTPSYMQPNSSNNVNMPLALAAASLASGANSLTDFEKQVC